MMAGDGEEETEYESDPEEAKMSLKMRRREASDDEDADEVSHHPRAEIVDSENESDGQGGAAEYDDDHDDGDEEDDEEEDEGEDYYDEQEEEYEEIGEGEGEGEGEVESGEVSKAVEGTVDGHEVVNQIEGLGSGSAPAPAPGEEEKKENEPFAVPTSGAFYMHDDRFRDNAGGRHRRTFGGRKLWESKDDRKWGHDKFEEMNMQDRHYEEGRRSSKGYYRGRGKGRGAGRGNVPGNRMRGFDGNNNQNLAPKDVRGRGPRRYQPSMKSKSEPLPPQNRQSAKSIDKTSHTGLGRNGASSASHAEYEAVLTKKVASNLNSASPPFYPSGSSTITQKKEVPAGNHNRNARPTVVEQNFSVPLSNNLLRGKNVTDSIGMDKLHVDDSVSPASGKPVNNVHLPFSESSSSSAAQMPHTRAQGRGVAPILQPLQSNNQINKISPPAAQAPQRNSVQNRGQASLQAPGQQLGHRPLGASQGSPPKAGKGTVQGAGTGAVRYAGAQVMGSGGNMGPAHGDQNLPAFFPVMQFGAQHPRGIGVPAVGMAFPGYVAQPNGVGNSEMTWLPVLASAAGALGAPYCPPYLAVDGTYHSRPTGQTSALPAPSKDNNQSKPNNEVKPQQRSEVSSDDFSQRQNKPRRYSEMNFSQ